MGGFRLYQVNTFLRKTRQPAQIGQRGSVLEDAGTYILTELEALKGAVFSRSPSYAKVPFAERPPKTGEPLMRIEESHQIGTQIRVQMSYGSYGSHERLIDSEGKRDDILVRGFVPTNELKVIFFLPKPNAVTSMIMAAGEVRGRTHVTEALPKLLSTEAWRRHDEESDESDMKPWARLRTSRVTDEDRIREIVEGGEVTGLVLARKKKLSKAGRLSSAGVTLTQNGLQPQHLGNVVKVVKGWVSSQATGGVSAIVEMVDGDVSSVGFSDGKFIFTEDGRQIQLGPSNLDRILTYPIEADPVDFEALAEGALERIKNLSGAIGFPVDV